MGVGDNESGLSAPFHLQHPPMYHSLETPLETLETFLRENWGGERARAGRGHDIIRVLLHLFISRPPFQGLVAGGFYLGDQMVLENAAKQ